MLDLRHFLPNPKFWLKPGKNQTFLIFVLAIFLVYLAVAPGVSAGVGNAVAAFVLQGMSGILEAIGNLMAGLLLWVVNFLIQLSGYNNFLDAKVVSVGWVLTRDVANMFYILILLVIAFATMLKIEKWSLKALLPRLIGTAILVNFSKTIIGILIDLGQVVMMTFVNGYAATAGGNFVMMFNLGDIFKVAPSVGDIPVNLSVSLFLGYLLGTVVLTVALIVTAIFAAILLFRIITLWFLVVMSPIAFLLGTIPGRGQSYYGKWWDNLINNILVGPLVAFFLWLTLATMGGGKQINEITGEGKNAIPPSVLSGQNEQGAGQAIPGAVTEFSKWENLGSFAVAIAMLLMGLQMIQEMSVVGAGLAGSASGFIKSAATGLAKRAAMAPVKVADRTTEGARSKAWLAASHVPGLGLIGLRRAGAIKAKQAERAQKGIAGAERAPLADRLRVASQWRALTPEGKRKKAAFTEAIIGDKRSAGEARTQWGADAPRQMSQLVGEYEKQNVGDQKRLDMASEFKSRNLDLVANAGDRASILQGMKPEDATKISASALHSSNPNNVYTEMMTAHPDKLAQIYYYGSDEQEKALTSHGYVAPAKPPKGRRGRRGGRGGAGGPSGGTPGGAGGGPTPTPTPGPTPTPTPGPTPAPTPAPTPGPTPGPTPTPTPGPTPAPTPAPAPAPTPTPGPTPAPTPAPTPPPAGRPTAPVTSTSIGGAAKPNPLSVPESYVPKTTLAQDIVSLITKEVGSDPEKVKDEIKKRMSEVNSGTFRDEMGDTVADSLVADYQEALGEVEKSGVREVATPATSKSRPMTLKEVLKAKDPTQLEDYSHQVIYNTSKEVGSDPKKIMDILKKERDEAENLQRSYESRGDTVNARNNKEGAERANKAMWELHFLDDYKTSPHRAFNMKNILNRTSDGKMQVSDEGKEIAGDFSASKIVELLGQAKSYQDKRAVAVLAAIKATVASVAEAKKMAKKLNSPAMKEIKADAEELIKKIKG